MPSGKSTRPRRRLPAAAEAACSTVACSALDARVCGHNAAVADLAEALGPKAFAAAWTEGQALDLDAAIALGCEAF